MMLLLLRSKLLSIHHHSAVSLAVAGASVGSVGVPLQIQIQSASLSPILRLLSTSSSPSNATTQNPPPPTTKKRHLLEQYLVKSCGFSPKQATRAAKHIPCSTSLTNPKSVVQFLAQNGLDLTDIRTAISQDPRFLLLHVESTLKPKVDALQKLGFSLSHITGLLCLYPAAFRCASLEQRIRLWMPIVGSVENLLDLVKKNRYILTADPDKVVAPNLDFLEKRCGFSGSQIVNMSASKLLTANSKDVEEIVDMAMGFGIPCCSRLFKNILCACSQKPQKIKSKIESLMSVGWSESEVLSMIRKQPNLLICSEENLLSKANFLTKDVGIDPDFVVTNPVLLMLSMNKRLVPRHRVLMELQAANLPDGRRSCSVVMRLSEQKFLDRLVFPNLDIIPDLYDTYTAVSCAEVPEKKGINGHAEILRAFQFSHFEVSDILRRVPKLVERSGVQMHATVDFLITFVGLNLSYIAAHPKILTYSLDRRLIPRYYVLKCLELKGLVRNCSILSVMDLKERDFVEKFINSHEGSIPIPGLAENYVSARAGRALKFEHKDVAAGN